MKIRRLLLLFGLAALVLAACGGGTTDEALPVDPDPDAVSPAAGACLEDEPQCDDTGALPDDANPLSSPGDDDGIISGGMVVDGGLSVSEALAGDVTGVIAVRGFLFDDGSGPVLCDALAESFPPQCPGVSLPVTGHEEVIDLPLISEQGVTWTDQTVGLFGEIVDGVLVVDPTVTG